MKVLIISGGKPDSKYPLHGNFEFDQATALAASGIDVVFFAIDLRSIRRKRKYGITHGYEKGVNWHTINIPIGAIPLSWFCKLGGLALLFLFKKVFKNQTSYPDIIHAHFTEMGNISAFLANKVNIPLVITEHSSAINEPIVAPEIIRCAKVGYLQAAKVIAVSQPLANNIFKYTGITARVIPNMINVEVFEHAEKTKHHGFNFVSTGGLIHRKRFVNLIRAFGDVARNYDDMYLHIIGDGHLRKELENLTVECGIKERVTFHGYKNAVEIAEIYGRCDCFVLVSAIETFGVVFVEAMAAGLPVIATRCGGPEDFVNEKNGILVDVDNYEQLCEAITRMKENILKYDIETIRSEIKGKYSPKMVAKKIEDLYNEVLS